MGTRIIYMLAITGIIPVFAMSQSPQDSLNTGNNKSDTALISSDSISDLNKTDCSGAMSADPTVKNVIISGDSVSVSFKCRLNEVSDILENIEDQLDDIRDDMEDIDKENNIDTIDASELSNKFTEMKTSFTTRLSKARAQGYGGGIMFNPMITGMSMKPVHELALNDEFLKKYTFPDLNDHYKPVLVIGGAAYGGVGNGVRIGFAGWSGSLSFNSAPRNDSILLLKVRQSFGGLLIEKAIARKNMNYLIGGIAGYGNLSVTKTYSDDTWVRINDSDDNNDNIDEKASTGFAGINLHGGFTVSVLPWMHLGLDANGTVIFSINGFNTAGCNSFVSVMPGLRLRITLGNIG